MSSNLYGAGGIRLSADDAQALNVPADLARWLQSPGLPILDGETLGVVFSTPRRVEVKGRGTAKTPMLDVGCEQWDGASLRLAVDLQTLAFVGYGDNLADYCVINSSIGAFVHCLALYQPVADQLNADVPPVTVRSAEESRRLVEAMLSGELRPPPAVRPAVSRTKLLKQLKDGIHAIDADALKPRRWWTRVLSQLRDGLI